MIEFFNYYVYVMNVIGEDLFNNIRKSNFCPINDGKTNI